MWKLINYKNYFLIFCLSLQKISLAKINIALLNKNVAVLISKITLSSYLRLPYLNENQNEFSTYTSSTANLSVHQSTLSQICIYTLLVFTHLQFINSENNISLNVWLKLKILIRSYSLKNVTSKLRLPDTDCFDLVNQNKQTKII